MLNITHNTIDSILLHRKTDKVYFNFKIDLNSWHQQKNLQKLWQTTSQQRDKAIPIYRRQIDITTYQLLFFLSDTSLCLFSDDMRLSCQGRWSKQKSKSITHKYICFMWCGNKICMTEWLYLGSILQRLKKFQHS